MFRTRLDCTPWVLGGLWPPDLQRVTPETALLADHLDKDLQRIAMKANERLRAIAEAGLDDRVRQLEESSVIDVARAFAARRVWNPPCANCVWNHVDVNPNSSTANLMLADRWNMKWGLILTAGPIGAQAITTATVGACAEKHLNVQL